MVLIQESMIRNEDMDVTLLAIHRVFSINSAEKQCTFVVRSKFYEANWATWQDLYSLCNFIKKILALR